MIHRGGWHVLAGIATGRDACQAEKGRSRTLNVRYSIEFWNTDRTELIREAEKLTAEEMGNRGRSS
jgi:hypothetical protein